jgi:hypothetical protein
MSLYRQASGASRRTLVMIGLGCLLAGIAVGFALGRGTAPDPALSELAAEARAEVRPAINALELVTIEYPEAVRGGKVVAATEYEAAVAQAASAADALAAAAPDLRQLDPGGHAAATEAVDEVVRLVGEEAEPGAVEAAAEDASAAAEALAEPAGG